MKNRKVRIIITGLIAAMMIATPVVGIQDSNLFTGCGGIAQAATKPSAPVITVKATSNSEITISWKALKNAYSYNVYRSVTKNKGFKQIATVSENIYEDVELKDNTTYYYKVDAYVALGSGAENAQTGLSDIKAATTKKDSFITIKNKKYSIYSRTLDLGNMELTDKDIAPISKMQKVSYIQLDRNAITDISSLKGLNMLTVVDLSYNQITDLSPLANKNIDSINIANNKISDITVIKEYINLEFIDATNNSITDLSPLKKLSKLQSIYIDAAGSEDASFLSGKADLELLHIYGKVTNLPELASILKSYKKFRDLGLFESEITDFLSLKQVKTMEYLSIEHKEDGMNIDDLYDFLPNLRILANDGQTMY